jgi:hypothetical protein
MTAIGNFHQVHDATPLGVETTMAQLALAIVQHLTYKSIREAIKAHDGRNLFCLPSVLLGEETPRAVFVSRELHEIVDGPPLASYMGGQTTR